MIIDRLFETLDERMRRWRNPGAKPRNKRDFRFHRSSAGDLTTPGDGNDKVALKKMLDERLNIALQIAAAMVYMHNHSIIFRDLKPVCGLHVLH